MAKAAQSPGLKAAFTKHERETRGQIARLEKVFKIIGKPVRGKVCDAINGITDEGAEIMEELKGAPALDAGLLASAQAVKHYEIERYGTLGRGIGFQRCCAAVRSHARRGENHEQEPGRARKVGR